MGYMHLLSSAQHPNLRIRMKTTPTHCLFQVDSCLVQLSTQQPPRTQIYEDKLPQRE